jgi:hypothetical protein
LIHHGSGPTPEPTIDATPRAVEPVPAAPPRLTMQAFWRDFGDEVFSLDRGVPWTFVRLLRNPGAAIRAYVVDRDARTTRPLRWFLIGFALLALAFGRVGGAGDLGELIRDATGDRDGAAAMWVVLQHILWLLLFTVPPAIAGGLRIAFARHAPSFAEMWVFALYACGQLLVYAAGVLLLPRWPGLDLLGAVAMVAGPPVFLLVACLGYFPQPGLGRVLRGALAAVLGGAFTLGAIAGVLWTAFHLGKAFPGVFGG